MTDEAAAALEAAYAAHAAAKEAAVAARIEAEGLGGRWGGIHRSPVAPGYRTQLSVYLFRDGGGVVPTGVDPRRGRVPLDGALWVAPEERRGLLAALAARLAAEPAAAGITGLDLRLAHGSLRAHLVVAARRDAAVRLDALAAELLAAHPALDGVAVPSQGIEIGAAEVRHALLGRTVLAHPRAFFQTNRWLTPALAEAAGAPARGAASLLDVYCGVGLHSVLAAAPETAVLGVDENPWAIGSAGRNAALHGLARARYERGTVEAWLAREEAREADVVFVNPSRHGCAPGLAEAVDRARPRAVCLVSCSIDAHLRDLRAFRALGWATEPFASWDMFPFTPFLESVSVLRRG